LSGMSSMSSNYSRLLFPHSQLYSKVNKKGDQKPKPKIENDEKSSNKVIEVEQEKTEDHIEIEEKSVDNGNQRPWNELKERNFTLEEILSLETNNEVRFSHWSERSACAGRVAFQTDC
jgi:hypothetical protein